ncbi:MAG: hypothetical protein JRH06_17005, partial [Deltaproteobacteria bacterium]|nr:hypothetical protein [Deltaproteobacteria bacterium]
LRVILLSGELYLEKSTSAAEKILRASWPCLWAYFSMVEIADVYTVGEKSFDTGYPVGTGRKVE